MNLQRVFVAVCIMILAAAGYAIGWGISVLLKQDEKTRISMIYGSGMRNISAGGDRSSLFSRRSNVSGNDRYIISAGTGGVLWKSDQEAQE